MKTIPDCIPDILSSVLDAAHLVSEDDFIHRKVLAKVMAELSEDQDFGTSPATLCFRCMEAAYKALGVRDPYEKEKARRNKAMLGLEKSFRAYLDVAPNRLNACLNLVLAGTLSRDILGRAEAEREILEHLDTPLAHDDRKELVQSLARADNIMYIIDAAGEIVLDKLLIEELGKKSKVTAVVAKKPVLAVATMHDAEAVGLDRTNARIIDPGAAMLGLVLERASGGFREAFSAADLVIVKGENNFETLSGVKRDLFFLLQAECESVAARLDIPGGSVVLLHHAGRGSTGVLEAVGGKNRAAGKP